MADELGLVLVVTADAAVRESHVEALHGAGYRVFVAEGAAEAGVLLRRVQPDVVVVDFRSPKRDAWILLRLTKELPSASTIAVIGLTESAMQGGSGVERATDCDAWLPRSCEPSLLLEQVHRVLERVVPTRPPPGG